MDLGTQLLANATDYAARRGISLARLATIVVNNGHLFERLAHGGGCTLRTYERFQHFFESNPLPMDPIAARADVNHEDAA